jgi:hypothetical protein
MDDRGAGCSILKVTRRPRGRSLGSNYGLNPDVISYLDRLEKMNVLAPSLRYRILGVIPLGTWPAIVTVMRHIHGVEPSGRALNKYMTDRLGFKDEGGNSYVHASGLRFGDVHTGNFIETPDGGMVPIDVTVEINPHVCGTDPSTSSG